MKYQNAYFGQLFKKYRLRSEFESLSDLSDALLQHHIIYHQSIFSRWQKGERIPTDRKVLLTLINVFVKRKGIATLQEVNGFLESAGQGYITNAELYDLPKHFLFSPPFQVPAEIGNFTGRQAYIEKVKQFLLTHNHVVLHGPAGIGKTSLAIKIGHILKDEFPDGVLWYRVDTSSTMDILAAIAYTYGENITHIQDISTRASLVRALFTHKKVLIIFDNVEKSTDLYNLLPNSACASILITSRYESFNTTSIETILPVGIFSEAESMELYEEMLGFSYVQRHNKILGTIAKHIGYLPLALHILGRYLQKRNQTPDKLFKLLTQEKIRLSHYTYENKDLYATLNITFENLDSYIQKIFLSLGLFAGTDFSIEAVSFIHKIPKYNAEELLEELRTSSLVEHSNATRYRLHPMIQKFIKDKLIDKTVYQRAALYYESFLTTHKKNGLQHYFIIRTEIETLLHVFEECYRLKYWESVVKLGRQVSNFLWETELWYKLEKLGKQIYEAANHLGDQHKKVLCCIEEFSWFYSWTGKLDKALYYTEKGLHLAEQTKDDYLIAYSRERLSQIYQCTGNMNKSLQFADKALSYFEKTENHQNIIKILFITAETNMLMGRYGKARELLYQAIETVTLVPNIQLRSIELARLNARLALILLIDNKLIEAEKLFHTSMKLEEQTGVKLGTQVWSRICLGLIYEQKKQKKRAQDYFDNAYQAAKDMGMNEHIGLKISTFFPLLKNLLNESKLYKPFY